MPTDAKAESYRVRAVELRAIAETMKDNGAQKILLKVADDYDQMAAQRDRMHLGA